MNQGIFCNDDIAAGELNTAIGCIPVNDVERLVSTILPIGIGIAGGVAFLIICLSTVRIMSSVGNPDRIQENKELLFAGLSGLILLIFGVFVYRLIGVDILRLPGL